MIIGASPLKTNNHADFEKSLESWTRDVLSHEIGFIPNPHFREFDAENRWRRELAMPENWDTRAQRGRSTMPAHLERMCTCPLLTIEEERDLFCRMNYLKYRANAIRSTLNENRPNVRKLEQVGQLLTKANEIRNRIVHSNMRLVISIVRTFADKLNPFERPT